MINHPVHISDGYGKKTSTFIPFCSFGSKVNHFGKELNNFQVPFCALFKEKIVEGQVCYEAVINQLKTKVDWKTALQKGLSLVIDTNDEYDVRNLLVKKCTESPEKRPVFDAYKEAEEENNFLMMLQTISEMRRPRRSNVLNDYF